MLGVEHGQMLTCDRPRARRVRCRAPACATWAAFRSCVGVTLRQAQAEVFGGRQRIRRIQAEIADQFDAAPSSQRLQNSGRARQDRAVEPQQKIQDLFFPGLQKRGLATRASIRAAFTRSTDGLRP